MSKECGFLQHVLTECVLFASPSVRHCSGLKFGLCQLLSLGAWVSFLTFLNFSLSICKMGVRTLLLNGCCKN